MQRSDRWPEDYEPDTAKSRPGSRRNSSSLSRKNSATNKEKEGKKEKEKKKSLFNSNPGSANSTPKRVVKPQNLDFVVTGRQCLKKSDRANSLPGYRRRLSAESLNTKTHESPKRASIAPHALKSRETSLEDDVSMDLSQVSDFEDTYSKYGGRRKFSALATSTPKPGLKGKRSASESSQQTRPNSKGSFDSKSRSSKDSSFKTTSSASTYRRGLSAGLDYSPASAEYSGLSSAELSPRAPLTELVSPRTIEPQASSCCSWQECGEQRTPGERDGEWSSFWANYNNSLSKVPVKNYYDQCPTPYRTENIDLADLGNISEFSTDGSRKRSPDDHMENINYIIRNEGLHLTPRETQNMIKCAHILGNVLSKAIERRCREKDKVDDVVEEVIADREDPELEIKKKTLTLELTETNLPADIEEQKKCETVTTQTDISLPNTKSAPRIFEKILRQLSKSSLDDSLTKAMDNKPSDKPVKDENEENVDIKIAELKI